MQTNIRKRLKKLIEFYGTNQSFISKNTGISHVLQAILLDESLATGTVRFSLGKYATPEEARIIADSIFRILR